MRDCGGQEAQQRWATWVIWRTCECTFCCFIDLRGGNLRRQIWCGGEVSRSFTDQGKTARTKARCSREWAAVLWEAGGCVCLYRRLSYTFRDKHPRVASFFQGALNELNSARGSRGTRASERKTTELFHQAPVEFLPRQQNVHAHLTPYIADFHQHAKSATGTWGWCNLHFYYIFAHTFCTDFCSLRHQPLLKIDVCFYKQFCRL